MVARLSFSKLFPIVRDTLIFAAAVVTIVFNYLSNPVRQDIRAAQNDIDTIKSELAKHETGNVSNESKLDNKLEKISDTLDTINTRLSRIEGVLGR